jgi:hypothetical protein
MRKWKNWTPKAEKFWISPDCRPTKLTKPGSVGFVSTVSGNTQDPSETKNSSVSSQSEPARPTKSTADSRKTDVSHPTRRCRVCNGWLFWISIHGAVVCSACHPPASRDLVKTWYWLPEGECKKTQ